MRAPILFAAKAMARGGVGEHVGGVRQQRQAVEDDAGDDFSDEEGRRQAKGDGEHPAVGLPRGVVVALTGAHGVLP
ncbi:hypothetical protein [Caulobacter henricii]|uniref:hypothetical protein n=1 Tax=Caulobacter henricii TaxID=69395 RepID=UPI002FFCB01F